MNSPELCAELADTTSGLFTCLLHGEYIRVRTPFLYPDGDNIDVFCRRRDRITLVSDLGETTRWLRMQTTSPRRSQKQKALIEDVCLTHGVEFYRGMLQARQRPGDSLGAVVVRVAQAALRIADLWFTFRTRSVETVADEVADFLSDKGFRFHRRQKLVGRSGRSWSPDFYVHAVERSALVYVLSTGSRSAARGVVHEVHTAFFDLSIVAAGPEALHLVSLFDDTLDVWSEEDFRLADQVSTIARWSQPDEFAEVLRAA